MLVLLERVQRRAQIEMLLTRPSFLQFFLLTQLILSEREGVQTGAQIDMLENLMCDDLQPSLWLVSVLKRRWKCKQFSQERMLIVPLSSMDKTGLLPPQEPPRTTFLLFKNTCQPEHFVVRGCPSSPPSPFYDLSFFY